MKKNSTMVINPIKSMDSTLDKNMLHNIFNKINEGILEQNEFEYLKKIAIINQSSLISYFNNKTGFRLKKINVVENNEIFEKLLNGINMLKIVNPSIKVEYIFDTLVVSRKINITEATFHNVIKISLRSGSYIKISSANSNSLEISVIRVKENKTRNGEGSRLMNIVFDFCYSQLEFRPRFILECTGNLESKGILASIGITVQTSFFEKFGFRVKTYKNYPNYVMMVSKKEEVSYIEPKLQLAA